MEKVQNNMQIYYRHKDKLIVFLESFFVLTALFGGLIRKAFNADTITYMVYAKDDAEFESIVEEMIAKANSYYYKECLDWSLEEAARRHEAELAVAGK